MLQLRPITTHQLVGICDRCNREMGSETQDGEWEERISISFRAGYHSIFGDGNLVECDLCQHCVKAILEKYLRVTFDDPFNPVQKPQASHYHAYQHFQLREEVQLAAIKDEMEKSFQNLIKRNDQSPTETNSNG